MTIIQGTARNLEFTLYDKDSNLINIDDIKVVEFCVGDLRKLYEKNKVDSEVSFEDNKFMFPLTEQESFNMTSTISWGCRIYYENGMIDATIPEPIEIIKFMDSARMLTDETR